MALELSFPSFSHINCKITKRKFILPAREGRKHQMQVSSRSYDTERQWHEIKLPIQNIFTKTNAEKKSHDGSKWASSVTDEQMAKISSGQVGTRWLKCHIYQVLHSCATHRLWEETFSPLD